MTWSANGMTRRQLTAVDLRATFEAQRECLRRSSMRVAISTLIHFAVLVDSAFPGRHLMAMLEERQPSWALAVVSDAPRDATFDGVLDELIDAIDAALEAMAIHDASVASNAHLGRPEYRRCVLELLAKVYPEWRWLWQIARELSLSDDQVREALHYWKDIRAVMLQEEEGLEFEYLVRAEATSRGLDIADGNLSPDSGSDATVNHFYGPVANAGIVYGGDVTQNVNPEVEEPDA
jgi:hypothetical protein